MPPLEGFSRIFCSQLAKMMEAKCARMVLVLACTRHFHIRGACTHSDQPAAPWSVTLEFEEPLALSAGPHFYRTHSILLQRGAFDTRLPSRHWRAHGGRASGAQTAWRCCKWDLGGAALAWTEKASRAVGVVVRAACPAAAYGLEVELVNVLATRVPTVACTTASLTPPDTCLLFSCSSPSRRSARGSSTRIVQVQQ